ncbi:protein JINGUBANG-like [Magnolia sinica]|uniref:protein JINGUBANG-like n=1 Tax=Magnolia sinica TaxID=86752 RepID=UPI00265A9622|nr:protein JINGUBANG-like [Magnolia sinica]
MALAISEAGHIYIGSDSKTIRVWKLPGFEEFGRLKSSYGGVSAILVSSEDRLVFTSHSDNKVRIWRSNPIHSRKGTLPSLKDCLIETCINRPMAIVMRATTISSKSITSNAAYRHKHVGAITCLAYNSLSKLLYSSSWDKTVMVWSICDMKCVETIMAHDDRVNAVVVGPDELLFTGSDDSTVKIWRRSLGGGCSHGLVLKLQLQFSAVKSLVMSGEVEESYILYVGCSDGQVHYWMKGELSGHMNYCGCLRGHSEAVLCLAVIDQIVISGSADTSIRVWRRSSDRLAFHCCVAILTGHTAPVKGVVVRMEDYRCVVYSGDLDGSAKQWLVWKEGCVGGDGAGRSGFVVNDGGSSWADYCEISRFSG